MVDPKSFTDEVQLASGGILTRQAPEGIKIAVIHRPRYNDWCLPKGKVDQQETLREAALREIREETACEALITGFAGTSSYTRDDLPKVVYFWNMTPSREYEFKPSAEVDQLLWLTPRKALTRLSHREERDLIARAFRVKISRAGFFRALTAFIGAGDLRGKRLEGSIATFQIELMRKIEKLGDSSEADKIKCLESAQQLLDAADTSLKNGDVDNGWRCFHAALRMEVQSMKPGELRNQAAMLMREAVKIRPWRKEAVEQILANPTNDPNKPDAQQVFGAMLLVHEHYNNTYYKIGLFRRQLTILAAIFGIIILAVLGLAIFDVAPAIGNKAAVETEMVIAVIVFGIMGGTLSSFLSFIRTTTESTIPDRIAGGPITTLRILVGAASALAIYVLAKSPLFTLIFSANVENDATILFLAFAAGFSERLVQRAVNYLAEKKP